MIIQPASLNLITIVRSISHIVLNLSFIQRPAQLQRVLHLERVWSSQPLQLKTPALYQMLDKEIQSEYGPFNLEIDLNTPCLSYRIRFAMELWDH